MNRHAILHNSDSKYCFAVDAQTVEIRLRTSSDDSFQSINLVYGCKYDYYLVQKRTYLNVSYSDKDFDYYSVTLKLNDVRLVYIFEINYKGKMYYYSEDGLSEKYDFSTAYFNSFQLPYINSADIMPVVPWMRSAVFYEIFVDRFCRAKFDKDDSYINLEWGQVPNPNSFAGGDLKGITTKLDYIKSLGVNALYLTPIFSSKSNHKYNTIDYYAVDEQFGSKADLKELINEAHKREIRIVLDAVFNHCSDKLMQFKDVEEKGKNSRYYNWFIIHGDYIDKKNFNYEYFGTCAYMPKLNTTNAEVGKFLLDIASYWIEEYNIDGWRLDVSDEVSHAFWRHFRERIKSIKPDCVIIGENWHDAHTYLRGDQHDSIMNYSLTKANIDFFADGTLDAKGFAHKLNALFVRNLTQVNYMMLNMLDSHDTHRFFTLLNKNIDKLLCALAVIFLHTGAAGIYYGTEIPLEGGFDPDCRRTMDWNCEHQENICKKIIRGLAELRNKKEIEQGDIRFYDKNGLFVMERRDKKTVRLTVNNTGNKISFSPEGETLICHNFKNNILYGIGFVVEEVGI